MNFPVLIGEVIPAALGAKDERFFPLRAWALCARFEYPIEAEGFLGRCGSAAEAFFARPFTLRPDVEYPRGKLAVAGLYSLELQVPCAGYRIDAVLNDSSTSLAIEIDGMAFHSRSKEQVANDYLRQRRIVLKGHTVIRFTAREVFQSPEECWRQVEAILAARRQSQ